MYRIINNAFVLLMAASLFAMGCGDGKKDPSSKDNKKTVITQKGSDTMVLLAQRWAELFNKDHTDVDIQVSGGGSGTGIAALINGTTDIADASRTMKPDEKEKVKAKSGSDVVEIPVARDGIAIYVHPSNAVKQLTMAQLGDIYLGKITNWKDVGGKDAKIILYGRENSSGTYEFFKEHVLKKQDFASTTQTLQGTAGIVDAVSKDENGIGYGGAAYTKGLVQDLMLVNEQGTAVPPTKENIISGAYPLSRYLYFYLAQQPTGPIKDYIDWILSPAGQAITTEMEYFPLK